MRFSDVSEVEAIILGDMEFPLDGSEPTPADEEERLIPFFVHRYQFNNGSFYTEVEALCQGLGAEYAWDADTQTATATYRDVTVEMTVGSSQVLVNGEPMELTDEMWDQERQELVEVPMPVRMENGKLVVPTYLFSVSRTTGGVWDIGISYIHIGDTMEQDPTVWWSWPRAETKRALGRMNRLGRTDSDRASPLVRKKKLHQGGFYMPGRYQNVQRFQYAFGKPRKGVLGRPGLAAVEALSQSRCLRPSAHVSEERPASHAFSCRRLNSGKINGSRF